MYNIDTKEQKKTSMNTDLKSAIADIHRHIYIYIQSMTMPTNPPILSDTQEPFHIVVLRKDHPKGRVHGLHIVFQGINGKTMVFQFFNGFFKVKKGGFSMVNGEQWCFFYGFRQW